ncbi:MAG: hypothetical protein ACRC1D_06020 [Culicoidibacterales bacterium]
MSIVYCRRKKCKDCNKRWKTFFWKRNFTREYRMANNLYGMVQLSWVDPLIDVTYMTVDMAMYHHPSNADAVHIQRMIRGWLQRLQNARLFKLAMMVIDNEEREGSHQPQLKDYNAQFLARSIVANGPKPKCWMIESDIFD